MAVVGAGGGLLPRAVLLDRQLELLVVLAVLLLGVLGVRGVGLLLTHRVTALRVLLGSVVATVLAALQAVTSVLDLAVAVLVVLQFLLQNSIGVFGLLVDG